MKRLFLGVLGVALVATLAFSQVNTVPQVGVITAFNTKRPTYAAVALALPPAASATDIACIAGSSTKTIYIEKLTISGSAGTLVTAPFTLVRRASVDTAGTAATTTANWANTIGKLDSNSATATATLISYSANPTINDSSPTYIRSAELTLPVTTAGTSVNPIEWRFGEWYYNQTLRLRGVAEQTCVNLNAVSVSSGLLHITTEWTEE